jgi:pimeloyl-ACP methyl ester carboxylesterase
MTAASGNAANSERRLRFAGLAAETRGVRGARTPIVLLHGLTFDHSMWEPVLDELGEVDRNRYTLAFDLPGHGQSPDLASYRLPNVAAQVHAAIEAAELSSPIIVGHSVSAIVATLYAGIYPTSGVVNVGQSLYIYPFAALIQAHANEIEDQGFDDVWQRLLASVETQLLPPGAQRLLAQTCRPRRDVAVGYWRDLLEHSLSDLSTWMTGRLAALRVAGVPYRAILGDEPDPLYRDWLASQLPEATVTVLPQSGHFPHLAHPREFAETVGGFADSVAGAD